MTLNQKEYTIIKLLGHGKGGYSYLACRGETYYVLKQIHHEPCEYYTFGNKLEAERSDYDRLLLTGIRIPKMIDVDVPNERILKEYVKGPTISELIQKDMPIDAYLCQVREMAGQAHAHGLNIDYFPTNFVVQEELVYYVDYECNPYSDEWSFENWGVKCYSKQALSKEEGVIQRG